MNSFEHTSRLERPWYKKGFVVTLALLFFFPVGLILMWAGKVWTPVVRWVVTAFFGLLAVLAVIAPEPPNQESEALANPCESGYGEALKVAEDRINELYQGAAWIDDGYGIAMEGKRTFVFGINVAGDTYCVMMVHCGEVAAVDCGNLRVKYPEFEDLVLTSNAAGAVFDSHRDYQAGRLAAPSGPLSSPYQEKLSIRQEAPTNTKSKPLGFEGATSVMLADVLGHWVVEAQDCDSEGGLWIEMDGDSTKFGWWEGHGIALYSRHDEDRTYVTLRTVEEGDEGTMEIQLGMRQGRLVLNPEFGRYCCGDGVALLLRCPKSK